jgi:hypothetical protein
VKLADSDNSKSFRFSADIALEMIMAKKSKGLSQIDHTALLRCVALYKRLSRKHSVELSAMILKDGWHAGAYFACRRLQAISLGLKPHEKTPSELYPQRIGGIERLWPVDARGLDEARPMTATIAELLSRYGLSKFEAHPLRALEAAEQRCRELGAAPSGDAA